MTRPEKPFHHVLKTVPPYFQAVWDGDKTTEVRVADRTFAAGDILVLREWIPTRGEYSKRSVFADVTYVMHGFAYGEDLEVVASEPIRCAVMSLRVQQRITGRPVPLARANAPETSAQAIEEMTKSGKKGVHRDLVLAAVRKMPGLTADEYSRVVGISRLSTSSRISELKGEGLVFHGKSYKAEGHAAQKTVWPFVEPEQLGLL